MSGKLLLETESRSQSSYENISIAAIVIRVSDDKEAGSDGNVVIEGIAIEGFMGLLKQI